MAWFKEINRDRQARDEEIPGLGMDLHAVTVLFGSIEISEGLTFSPLAIRWKLAALNLTPCLGDFCTSIHYKRTRPSDGFIVCLSGNQ
jgi:hypothetical protein